MTDKYRGSLEQHIKKTIKQLKTIKEQTDSVAKQEAIQQDIQKLNERLERMAKRKALEKEYGVTGKIEESEKIWLIRNLEKLIEKHRES